MAQVILNPPRVYLLHISLVFSYISLGVSLISRAAVGQALQRPRGDVGGAVESPSISRVSISLISPSCHISSACRSFHATPLGDAGGVGESFQAAYFISPASSPSCSFYLLHISRICFLLSSGAVVGHSLRRARGEKSASHISFILLRISSKYPSYIYFISLSLLLISRCRGLLGRSSRLHDTRTPSPSRRCPMLFLTRPALPMWCCLGLTG